eukprot:scaffold16412_cov59-Phaeocystis_antarctica.AAC.6
MKWTFIVSSGCLETNSRNLLNGTGLPAGIPRKSRIIEVFTPFPSEPSATLPRYAETSLSHGFRTVVNVRARPLLQSSSRAAFSMSAAKSTRHLSAGCRCFRRISSGAVISLRSSSP